MDELHEHQLRRALTYCPIFISVNVSGCMYKQTLKIFNYYASHLCPKRHNSAACEWWHTKYVPAVLDVDHVYQERSVKICGRRLLHKLWHCPKNRSTNCPVIPIFFIFHLKFHLKGYKYDCKFKMWKCWNVCWQNLFPLKQTDVDGRSWSVNYRSACKIKINIRT